MEVNPPRSARSLMTTKPLALSSPSSLNWTETLGKNGLESPGYHEAVEAAKISVAQKLQEKREAQVKKKSKKKGRSG